MHRSVRVIPTCRADVTSRRRVGHVRHQDVIEACCFRSRDSPESGVTDLLACLLACFCIAMAWSFLHHAVVICVCVLCACCVQTYFAAPTDDVGEWLRNVDANVTSLSRQMTSSEWSFFTDATEANRFATVSNVLFPPSFFLLLAVLF